MVDQDLNHRNITNIKNELRAFYYGTFGEEKGNEKWVLEKNNNDFLSMRYKVLTAIENGEKRIKNQIKNYFEKQGKKDLKEYQKRMAAVQIFIKNEHYPLLLEMMMHDRPLSEINTVLSYLLNVAIKKCYFKKEPPTSVVFKTINDVRKKNGNNYPIKVEKIIEAFKNKSDSITNKKLRCLIVRNKINPNQTDKIKFILKEIFNSNCSKQELNTNSPEYIELEHILPQGIDEVEKMDSQWLKDFGEDKEYYTYVIGNLTLLEKNTIAS